MKSSVSQKSHVGVQGRVSDYQFSHGCIVRVQMVHFMHYSDVSIRPQPGFNVIIGHNGSGKSALVNAICVGNTGL